MPNVGGKKFPYTDEGKAAAKEEAAKSGKKMTMGYKAGGKLEMVEKDGKKVPFYAADGKGKMAAGGKVNKKRVTSKDKLSAKAKKDEIKSLLTKNNTSDPKPKTPAQAATPMPTTGGATKSPMMASAGAGGMGAKMPMMKKGGKVKKSKSYGHGGKVRGAGIAKKGVRKCKMR